MNYFDKMCAMTGYRPLTTFWDDFTIADQFDKDGIMDTYQHAFNEWKSDYKYLTELILVLNWKCWEKYETGNAELSELYGSLFYQAQDWAYDNLQDEELSYLLRTLD